MFLPRLDPLTADALAAPTTPAAPAARISRASRRTARASAWMCLALAVPATIALIVLGFVLGAACWIAALLVGSVALAFGAGTAILLRPDGGRFDRSRLAARDRDSLQRMAELHTAHITGISRSLGRAVGGELEQLLDGIERRWTVLAAAQHDAEFEEGRQRADYPRTADQRARIAALAAQRADVRARCDELLEISRALPGRISALADNPARRVEPGALRLAMIEAQLRIDDVLAAAPTH